MQKKKKREGAVKGKSSDRRGERKEKCLDQGQSWKSTWQSSILKKETLPTSFCWSQIIYESRVFKAQMNNNLTDLDVTRNMVCNIIFKIFCSNHQRLYII